MAAEVASAYVSLIPSARGFKEGIKRELNAPLKQTGTEAGRTLSKAIGDEGDGGGRRFGRLFGGGMSGAFEGAKQRIAASAGLMVPAIAAALVALPAIAAAAAGGMVLAFGGGFTAIGLLAIGTTKKMKKEFASFGKFALATFRDAAKPLQPVLEELLSVGRDVIKSFAPVFKSFFSAVRGPLTGFIDSLGNALIQLKPVIPAIADAFSRLLRSLGPQLPTIFSSLADGIVAVANAIGQNPGAFTSFIQTLVRIFVGVLKLIALMVRFPKVTAAVIGIVIALGVTLLAFVAPVIAVIAAVAALVAAVILYFPQIKNAIITAWNAVKNFTVAAWNAIKGFVSSAASAVKNAVVGAWNAVKSATSRAWNAAKALVSGAWNGIKNAVSSGISRVLGFVRSLPGKILHALGHLGSLLYNAGKNIISGLIRGITAKFGALVAKARSIASTIRNFLPFSPAKEGPLSGRGSPELAGAKIATMLADGMRSQRGTVARAASVMAGAASVNGTAALGLAGAGASRGGMPVRVVLDVTGADEDMKRLIRKMVRVDGRGNVQAAFGRP